MMINATMMNCYNHPIRERSTGTLADLTVVASTATAPSTDGASSVSGRATSSREGHLTSSPLSNEEKHQKLADILKVALLIIGESDTASDL